MKWDGRNTYGDSENFKATSEYDQEYWNRNNQSVGYRETSTGNARLFTGEQGQQGINEDRQATKKSTSNKQRGELDNSSFSYDENAKRYEDLKLTNKIEFFKKNLRNKWENAYRNTTTEQATSNLNNNTSFSIQQDNNGNKYVNVDTDQNIFDGKNLFEQTKIAKKYILDNFRKNGLFIGGDNINITTRTANEYTHSKKDIPTIAKQSKMKASTELDNLLSISQYETSKPDDGRHLFAKDGWDYYKTTFKVGDIMFTGLINVGKNGDKKTLYDITNIKKIDQNYSTSANAFAISLVNSNTANIPQSNTNVNSGTKYSMQENVNNAKKVIDINDKRQLDDIDSAVREVVRVLGYGDKVNSQFIDDLVTDTPYYKDNYIDTDEVDLDELRMSEMDVENHNQDIFAAIFLY